MTKSSWPPRTSDRSAVLHAYEKVLGWGLLAEDVPVTAAEADRLLTADPALMLRTRCTGFELVSAPHELGLDALVLMDRTDVSIPCVRSPGEVTFLVQAGTAHVLADIDLIRAETGPKALLTLPPSPDLRWDTPPWLIPRPGVLPLPQAAALARALRTVTRSGKGGSPC